MVRIADFGAFVEIFPGTDGLLHISEIADTRIRAVRDELKEGDQILVKVLAIEGNKIRLSRKAVLKEQRDKQQSGTRKLSRLSAAQVIRKREADSGLPFLFGSIMSASGMARPCLEQRRSHFLLPSF